MKESTSKSFLSISAGIACLLIALCVGVQVTRPAWYKDIKMEVTNQPNARVVTVAADGKVTAKPDIAIMNFSVVSQGATVKVVTNDGNVKMTKVIAALKALKIDAKDIQSTQYSLSPEYRYDMGKSPTITGYRLDQQVTVKIRNLELIDDALQNTIDAGANQVGQLTFDIDDPAGLKSEARTLAFKTAREKAEAMAKSAGVKLGRVVTFSEGDSYQPPMYANYRLEKAQDAVMNQAPTIESGSQEIRLNVSVTYEIE